MNDIIKMLRYNTGTDKKAFIEFKNYFDAVIFNATIVAYSGSAVADLVSVYKNQYIIDPQTHIMQHSIDAVMSKSKNNESGSIKKSVNQYLEQMPNKILEIMETEQRNLEYTEICSIIDELVEKVYIFETEYVSKYVKKKEYDKYLEYANIKISPRLLIAPYFMLKKDMDKACRDNYLKLNVECLKKFIVYNNEHKKKPIAAQLVMDSHLLNDREVIDNLVKIYNIDGFEYIFIWIDDFSPWNASMTKKETFVSLIEGLNKIGKKPLMAYGGYDSILLCHSESKARMYGVAQSVGYGEKRAITPVGGGLPVNKYYFGPLHKRIKLDEAFNILIDNGYLDSNRSGAERANDFYRKICHCPQCKAIIKDNIDNFASYNESIPYLVKGRYGDINRNRPTSDANFIAARHFLYYKCREWKELNQKTIKELIEELILNYKQYGDKNSQKEIGEWCDLIGR